MVSTTKLELQRASAIDLQVHTVHSDGHWTPEALLQHAQREQFGLIAITDHDRPDTAAALQQLASAMAMPVLVAAEMTTTWRGGIVDVLCFGYALNQQALSAVAHDVLRRQQDNTRKVYERLCQQGYLGMDQPSVLHTLLETPSAQQPHALVALMQRSGVDAHTAEQQVWDAGCGFAATDIATVVAAAHQSGAVCIVAHPGRDDGFVCFDTAKLDQLRADVPIDGIEVYYPKHAPAQIAMYQDYAAQHNLLVSAGSDSHGPDKPPIKYPAELCRALLERLGIRLC